MWPKISVITVVYNGEPYIERAINSLIDQGYPNLEYIVIDGGSTDNTINTINKYKKFITKLVSEPDKGANHACSKGFALATGDIICLLNSDDRYEGNILSKIAEMFISNPQADVVSCAAQVVKAEKSGNQETIKKFDKSKMKISLETVISSPVTNARFFHKSIFEKYGEYRPINERGEHLISADKEFMIRIALGNAVCFYTEQVGYTYLSHDKSLTFSKNYKTQMQIGGEHLDIYERFLQGYIINKDQKKIFKNHHRKDSIRMAVMSLKARDYKSFLKSAKRGLKVNNILWVMRFLAALPILTARKVSRLIRKSFYGFAKNKRNYGSI